MAKKGKYMKKRMKWWQEFLIALLIAAGILFCLFLILAALVLWLFGHLVDSRSHEFYEVENINGKNILNAGSTYYFYSSSKTIYGYSLADNEKVVILEEEQRIWDFCSYGDQIFYSLRVDAESGAGQEIWEYNWVSGEKSLLLEDAECTYITAYNNYLIYDNFAVDYICAIGGDMRDESTELLFLFDEEDKSGEEQFTVFQGMLVGRQYDSSMGAYGITCVKGETGEDILKDLNGPRVLVNDSLFSAETLQWKDSLEEMIKPTRDLVEYIGPADLTVEDGKIIGLTSALHHYPVDQDSVDFDFLFEVDPETGQIRILYSQKTNMPRIIGYKDGMVYLMENYKLYREPIDGGERVELFDLPEENTMHFKWYGDYLMIRGNENKIIGAYLVK